MRVFRFLQARPYWPYKVAGVVSFPLVLANVLAAQQGTMFYPMAKFALPISILMFIISIIALVTEFIRCIIGKLPPSVLIHIGFPMFIIATVFGSMAHVEYSLYHRAHVASVAYGDHVYSLAETSRFTSLLLVGGESRIHILYECDGFGIICRALHEQELSISRLRGTSRDPQYYVPTVIELSADADQNAISILVDGEVAYTYTVQ